MKTTTFRTRQGYQTEIAYTEDEAKELNLKYHKNWRDGDVGEWVLTDDGWVIRILKVYYPSGMRYKTKQYMYSYTPNKMIKTAYSTTPVGKTYRLEAVVNGSRHRIGVAKGHLSRQVKMFGRILARTMDINQSYADVFGYVGETRKRQHISRLFKREAFVKFMEDELKLALDKVNLDKAEILKMGKDLFENAKSESIKKEVWEKFLDILEITGKPSDGTSDLTKFFGFSKSDISKLVEPRKAQIGAPADVKKNKAKD